MAERALLGGRYELGPAIGSGGFATVFRARDRHANIDVAVKLVPPGFDASRIAARLESEARVLTKLSSRHLARVIELGADEQGAWLVTELIDGVPLSVEGLGRALLPHEVLRVARGLLEGLSVAHAAGVVHADVKPSNILVPRTENALDGAKLIDFGLARLTARADVARELGDSAPQSGVVMGSARWMAPEVLSGRDADMRSDVYSAGLVLFELLGEGDLFPAEERQAQLRARVTTDPVLEGRVAPPLSSVLARMLARDPSRRYRDGAEALGAVIDLDTAPVSTLNDASPPSRGPTPRVSPAPSVPVSTSRAMSTRPPPSAGRLSALPESGVDGLRDTLRHLDLPMLDALARRERGNATGRVARAVALALRLELDAAALILEPLAPSSDIARAV
ncbi:MAG TPA: serine/threonine-protein kinase, partial [Labilithrix sp.]|nr:serine/threonine-protein kinase [Labilithrix sp.]